METTKTMPVEMARDDFNWFRRFIESETGIHLPDTKYVYLYHRISKRMNALAIESVGEYRDLLETGKGRCGEKNALFEEIVISESSFFRYQIQFEKFRSVILPDLVRSRINSGNHVNVFSLGSSRGQEIYSVAMILNEDLSIEQKPYVRLTALDLSEKMVKEAREGLYSEIDMAGLPRLYLDRYFIREETGYRLLPRVAGMVTFSRLNLVSDSWRHFREADVIFCRNTIIYFGKKIKESITGKIISNVRPGGYILLGHSEMIDTGTFNVTHLGNNIYRKDSL